MQILMAIWASLPPIVEEAILQATGVPDANVAVITGVTSSFLRDPGEAPPKVPEPMWGLWHLNRSPQPPAPLGLPAECFSNNEDLTSGTEMESDS